MKIKFPWRKNKVVDKCDLMLSIEHYLGTHALIIRHYPIMTANQLASYLALLSRTVVEEDMVELFDEEDVEKYILNKPIEKLKLSLVK